MSLTGSTAAESKPPLAERYIGCLVGGAIGDALGAPVEFMKLWMILERFGKQGVRAYGTAYGRKGAITDDTQMTLFTAEGLIRAHNRWIEWGRADIPRVVHRAYLRWLDTQQRGSPPERPDGWLAGIPELYSRRAPGNTCLSALASGEYGTPGKPINRSKGCGGVMRAAPAGMTSADPFSLGCEVAAITHSHPSGWLAAGFFARVVHGILGGRDLEAAVAGARGELLGWEQHEEVLAAVDGALEQAAAGKPSFERVETLGEGWVAEEALAMALYCVLVTDDVEESLALAVTHSGDSDSTGALAGNLIGALRGPGAFPAHLREELELADVIEQLARDLYAHFCDPDFVSSKQEEERYPGF